jgi:hypothetical protein
MNLETRRIDLLETNWSLFASINVSNGSILCKALGIYISPPKTKTGSNNNTNVPKNSG